MAIDVDDLLMNAMRDGLREAIARGTLNSWDSPIGKLIKAALDKHTNRLTAILENAVSGCVNDPAFAEEIGVAVRSNLAKVLVQRFGGEIEKQVNALKSDPTTRARITLAIEEIVKQKT